jgi:hypothetical protein
MHEKIKALVAFNLINELQKNPALLERFSVENICELALRDTQKEGPITEEQIRACHRLLTVLETIKSELVIPMSNIMSRVQPGHKRAWPDLIPKEVQDLLSNELYTKLLNEAFEKVKTASQQQIKRITARD